MKFGVKGVSLFLVWSLWAGSALQAEVSLACDSSAACQAVLNSFYHCDDFVCVNNEVQRLNLRNVLGLTIVFVVSGIAISAGIGGGAIFTVIFLIFQKFEPGEAIPLSQIAILASAIVSFCVIIKKRHPNDPQQLLINFPMIAKLIPTVASGSLVGVILNKLLPPLFILVALCYLLIDLTLKIYQKALAETAKERKAALISSQPAIEKALLESELTEPVRRFETNSNVAISPETKRPVFTDVPSIDRRVAFGSQKLNTGSLTNVGPITAFVIEEIPEASEKDFKTLIEENKPHLYVCGLSLVLVVSTSFLRGGKGMDSIIGIDPCGLGSMVLLAICFCLCYFLDVILFWLGWGEAPSEEGKSNRRLGLIVGVVGSTLGLGGGVVLNPVLLRRGLPTQECFAISGTIVLFNAFISAVQFFIVGAYSFGNTFIVLVVTALGSLFGTVMINKAIEKYKRSAFLLWILFGLLVASSIIQPVNGFLKFLSGPAASIKPGSFC